MLHEAVNVEGIVAYALMRAAAAIVPTLVSGSLEKMTMLRGVHTVENHPSGWGQRSVSVTAYPSLVSLATRRFW